MLGRESHPARYPGDLPRFFISFLTDPDDLVMDIFSGSNTTGRVAEETGRRWISIEANRQFAVLSAARFMTTWDDSSIQTAVADMENGRAIDLDAGLSLGPAREAPRRVGAVQNQLFE
jgi:site-specific DNA-methyltransferase (cytosine-N4-specific)